MDFFGLFVDFFFGQFVDFFFGPPADFFFGLFLKGACDSVLSRLLNSKIAQKSNSRAGRSQHVLW